MDPDARPSFDDILNELQARAFEMFPGGDAGTIAKYVAGILAWEDRAASIPAHE
jgi:hypothetical protein